MAGPQDEFNVSLRHHLETRIKDVEEKLTLRIADLEKSIGIALSSAERALNKAESATDKRFDGVNEFRSALYDNQRTFLPRLEYEQAHKNLADRIEVLTTRVTAREAETTGLGKGWIYLVGVMGFIATLVSIIYMIFISVKK